jgi:hypothetical protein
MGFRKGASPKEVAVTVPAPWKGDGEFTFYFARRPSNEALQTSDRLIGLLGDERREERRKALVQVVAELSTREPEGFDDFPRETEAHRNAVTFGTNPLGERIVEYFDDPEEPDLERIIAAAWNFYIVEASPRAYLKSGANFGAGGSQPSGVSDEAAP